MSLDCVEDSRRHRYLEEIAKKSDSTAFGLVFGHYLRPCILDCLFSETYCGGYSGEDPPLPIPNREVKLTIADGTAPPGGRVGSCHFLIRHPVIYDDGVFCYALTLTIEQQ